MIAVVTRAHWHQPPRKLFYGTSDIESISSLVGSTMSLVLRTSDQPFKSDSHDFPFTALAWCLPTVSEEWMENEINNNWFNLSMLQWVQCNTILQIIEYTSLKMELRFPLTILRLYVFATYFVRDPPQFYNLKSTKQRVGKEWYLVTRLCSWIGPHSIQDF